MSGAQFTLTPGVVSTLGPQLQSGTAIVNNDASSSVWVSALASVQPGYGARIGPKGSLIWSGDSPCYAVTDTGVSAPVVVNTSTDISQITNPVDVGVAVSQQLSANGVPSVWTGAPLGNGGLPSGLDVSGYASVTISLTLMGPGYLQYYFTDEAGLYQYYGRAFSIGAACSFSFTASVTGPRLYVLFSGTAGTRNVSVFGTNRSQGDKVLGVSAVYSQGITQAWTAGQVYVFPAIFVTNGGLHQCRFTITSGQTGFYGVEVIDPASLNAQSLMNFYLTDTGQGHSAASGGFNDTDIQLVLPPGAYSPVVNVNAAGTYLVKMNIVPIS